MPVRSMIHPVNLLVMSLGRRGVPPTRARAYLQYRTLAIQQDARFTDHLPVTSRSRRTCVSLHNGAFYLIYGIGRGSEGPPTLISRPVVCALSQGGVDIEKSGRKGLDSL